MKSSAVLLAAVKWWSRHRPIHWSKEEHLKNPTVNMRGFEEHALAEAIADAVREKDK